MLRRFVLHLAGNFSSRYYLYFLIIALSALAGCQTVPNRELSTAEIGSLRLVSVSVMVSPGAIKSWPEIDGDKPATTTGAVAASSARSVSPAERDRRLVDRIHNAVSTKIGPRLTGSRPVRAVVSVREFEIIPKEQRAMTGGRHKMIADVTLIDAGTGQELLAYREQTASLTAAGGAAGIVGGS
jgi:hypothetical protein